MAQLSIRKKDRIILAKKDITPIESSISLSFDYSFSMHKFYVDGTIQRLLIRLLPLFDRLKCPELKVYLFNEDYKKISLLSYLNVNNYVTNVIANSRYKFGATRYAPILKALLKDAEDEDIERYNDDLNCTFDLMYKPHLHIIVSDGDIVDIDYVESILVNKEQSINYFIFLSFGKEEDFRFAHHLADVHRNIDFIYSKDINLVKDEKLQYRLLYKYLEWANSPRIKQVLVIRH